MERYRNLSGESGVEAFELLPDGIAVRFQDGAVYLYDFETTGSVDVEEMKRRAIEGRGLSTYISRVVRERFARRLR